MNNALLNTLCFGCYRQELELQFRFIFLYGENCLEFTTLHTKRSCFNSKFLAAHEECSVSPPIPMGELAATTAASESESRDSNKRRAMATVTVGCRFLRDEAVIPGRVSASVRLRCLRGLRAEERSSRGRAGPEPTLRFRLERNLNGDGGGGSRRCRRRPRRSRPEQGALCKYTFRYFTNGPSVWIAINNRDPNQVFSGKLRSKLLHPDP
jgi:hypothetical protein